MMDDSWRGVRRRGFALLMVVAVIAVAAVMAYAVLATAALQTQTSGNTGRAQAADALAESGVNLALYCLQHPERAISPLVNGYWPGGQGMSLGDPAQGTIDVQVRPVDPPRVYEVTSIGRTTSGLARTIVAEVEIVPQRDILHALSFDSGTTLPAGTAVTGDVQIKGNLTLNVGSAIEGDAYLSGSLLGSLSTLLGSVHQVPSDQIRVPSRSSVRSYLSYEKDGVSYSATQLPGASLSGAVFGPTADNPAGIFYYDGNLDLLGNVTINGTLLVTQGGRLAVRGPANTITPQPGYPAAIIDGDIRFFGSNNRLDINGLTWVGGNISSTLTATGGRLVVNGAMMFGDGGAIDLSLGKQVTVNYLPQNVVVNDFDEDNPAPRQIRILSWTQPRQ